MSTRTWRSSRQKGKDYVALGANDRAYKRAPSGRVLRLVEPGGEFRAAFRIRVDALQ